MKFLLAFLLAITGYAAHAQLSGGGGRAPESAVALQQKCDAGNAVACANLGFRHLRGDGLPKDAKQALTLFVRACDGGDAIGCTSAGDIHFSGEAVTRNLSKAAALYQRGCDGGDGEGCVALALSHGKGEGAAKDDARTALYADRACKLNNQLGCALLGLAFADGVEGYTKDTRRADDLLSTACLKGARFSERPDAASRVACPGLAKLRGEPSCITEVVVGAAESKRHCYDDKAGWVTTVTPRAAAPSSRAVAPALPAAAAPAVAANAANLAGIQAYDARDYGTALMRYAEACDQGVATACGSLGAMYFKGTGVSRNGARAAAPLATACDAGQTYACAYLAVLYDNGDGVAANKVLAFRLYNSACLKSDMASCQKLGQLYERGQGTAANVAQAAALYQQSCSAGQADGCVSVGNMYANGVYFGRNEAQALSFFRRACTIGATSGCEQAGRVQSAMNRSTELAFAKAAASMPARVVGSAPCLKANQFGDGGLVSAEQYARQGVKQNDPYCMHIMGYVYEKKQDFELAFAYYTAAANKNFATSMHNIGGFYHHGQFVQRNYRTAISWYERALVVARAQGDSKLVELAKRNIEGSKFAMNPPPVQVQTRPDPRDWQDCMIRNQIRAIELQC